MYQCTLRESNITPCEGLALWLGTSIQKGIHMLSNNITCFKVRNTDTKQEPFLNACNID